METVIRARTRLQTYYADALARRIDDDEGLLRPPAADFATLLSQVPADLPRHALDLGYGYGVYVHPLVSAGFTVEAVDIVPAHHLRARLTTEAPGFTQRVSIRECDLRDFVPTGHYGFVVARDVLHFLDRPVVGRLLGETIARSGASSSHYVTMFTDIARTDRDGRPAVIEGEAGLSATEWSAMATDLYAGWALEWHWAEHVQRNRSTGQPYFRAIRATLLARRRGG